MRTFPLIGPYDVGIEWVIGASPAPIVAGSLTEPTGFLEIPLGLAIMRWTIMADQVGSIVFDLWKCPYANFPPTIANTITAGLPPTLAAAQTSQSAILTGWKARITPGEILGINVNSASTVTQVTLSLACVRV